MSESVYESVQISAGHMFGSEIQNSSMQTVSRINSIKESEFAQSEMESLASRK
jgi:hypothetical protein